MKRKRFDRDTDWGAQYFPYYQMRLDVPDFHGRVCLICMLDGENQYWQLPRAGQVAVIGAGMRWLQLIPDGAKHILTVKFRPDGRVALWYADMIDRIEQDPDGVLAFVDAYLDVIFTPQGDVKLDDLDELRSARKTGEISARQYWQLRWESILVRCKYCLRPLQTETWCQRLMHEAEAKLKDPDTFCKNA